MGGRHSHEIHAKYNLPGEAERTRKRSNKSPKQQHRHRAYSGTSENNNSATSSASSNSWIHHGVDVESVYDLHEVIAYGHLGKVNICSRRRQQHSNHTDSFIMVDNVITSTRSERTCSEGSSESSAHTALGKGSYHCLYACKSISTSRLMISQQDDNESSNHVVDSLLQQVTTLRELPPHPSILTLVEVYTTKRQLWLVTELCTGGDLFSRLEFLTELDVVDVLEQLVDAVSFLHSHGLTHSNLKMENVLYEHAGNNAGIKVVDFGMSQQFQRCRDCRTVCGADYATAPEVYCNDGSKGVSSPASDVWSIGVIAFYMLSGGTYPFGTDYTVDTARLQEASFDFGDEWTQRDISDTARTFITRCLQADPSDRWTASEALEYIKEWMTTVETSNLHEQPPSEPPVMDVSLRGVQGFGLHGQRRKRLLQSLADTMDKTQLEQLQEIFLEFDSTDSGTLTLAQVKKAVKHYCKEEESSCDLSKEDFKEMFKGCHQDRSGSIEYVPFLKAVLQMQGMMTQERLGDIVDRADPEDKGLLEKDELKRILAKHCDEEYVGAIVKECETKDGMLDYDAVLQRMFQDPAEAMDHVSMIRY